MSKCKAECCDKDVLAKGYCGRHYKQMKTYGKLMRTRYDPNEIIIKGDYAEVLLYDKNGNERASTLIDIQDIELINKHKWCYKEGYVMSNIVGNNILLHRFLMKLTCQNVVDHINHDTLDNRKNNLRICTAKENSRNQKDVIGVYHRKSRDSWRAKIMVDGRSIYLGTYKTIEEAKQARILGEKEYFGEFATIRRSINE